MGVQSFKTNLICKVLKCGRLIYNFMENKHNNNDNEDVSKLITTN